jgi:hypothetical protein
MLSTKNRTSWPLVAEIFGQGQAGQRDAGTRARRLVHLAVDQGLGAFAAAFLVHAGFDHLPVEVVALAGPLAHTGEHRVTAVRLGDVVDQFLIRTVLPTPAPPNRPILPPLA